MLSEVVKQPDSHLVFDSSKIPGEILDLMVVKTDKLKAHPELGKALAGAWYEVMYTMSGNDAKAKEARTAMAKASGTDLAGYEAQLNATKMFYNPVDALSQVQDPHLKLTMQLVAEFSLQHGLLGESAPSADFIGIETPAGIFGDKNNVKLRFDPTYMQMAADGKL
mgnify:FL=1